MTENHGFDTPDRGTTDWQVPLNRNFERLDTAVEIRAQESELDDYEPKADAKFHATDTGNVYVGDGSEWSPVPVASHDHQQLSVGDSLRLPVKNADPDSPATGEVWFRGDAGELRVQTANGTQTLGGTGVSSDTETETSYDVTESFEDESWATTFGDVWDYGVGTNATVEDVAGRDGSQLEVTVPGGENRGMYTVHNHASRTGESLTECYHKFALRFEPGFTDAITDDGKLPGFAGRDGTDEGAGGSPANGTGWSARMGWDDPGDHGPGIALDWYLYHMDAGGSYGEHDYWGELLDEAQWYEIEQYIDLGTPGANDGVLRGWIDGTKEYERTDLRWRDEGGNDVQWSWLDFYHGGGNTPDADTTVQFDNFGIVRDGMPQTGLRS